MNQQSEEQIFGQYVDEMLKSLQSEKFDRNALRTRILAELLATRQQSEEQIFGQYVDEMLRSLYSEKFDRGALRTRILADLLATRQTIIKKIMPNTSESPTLPDLPVEKPSTSTSGPTEAVIRSKAEEIATWHNSYDTLIWLWAKSSLELKTGAEPTAEMIISIAEYYALSEKDIHKIHWYLAENLLKLQRKS